MVIGVIVVKRGHRCLLLLIESFQHHCQVRVAMGRVAPPASCGHHLPQSHCLGRGLGIWQWWVGHLVGYCGCLSFLL